APWGAPWAAPLPPHPARHCPVALALAQAAPPEPPRGLPRLDFQAGVPEDGRTMVAVPTLLTDVAGVVELLERVEVLALLNVDPRIHFAILGDFADAPTAEMPADDEILDAARAGVVDLN